MAKKHRDRRYQIDLEWCGYVKPKWVVRFCDRWIGKANSRRMARSLADNHHVDRLRSL